MAAQYVWRLKGLSADLVIVNEEGGSYFEELDQQLHCYVRPAMIVSARQAGRRLRPYSGLMSDCAERAVSELCDGAAIAASGSAADTVTVSEMLATVSRIEISCDPSLARRRFSGRDRIPGRPLSIV